MTRTIKKYYSEFKLKVVVEVLKGDKTAAQLAGELEVHPMVLSEWKKTFMETGAQLFERQKMLDFKNRPKEWGNLDLNQRPAGYESAALTN